MSAPAYLVPDYVAALHALLPRGRAWSRDGDTTQTAVLTGLAEVYEDSNQDANDLLVQAFPATADEMLPEWEYTFGLPESTTAYVPHTVEGTSTEPLLLLLPTASSLSERQRRVVAALTNTGGQSVAYFIALAAALGFTITITQFTAYNVRKPVGVPIAGDGWAHTWRVNARAADAITYTPTADVVPATPNFGNPTLDAMMGAFKPAHTVVIMAYT